MPESTLEVLIRSKFEGGGVSAAKAEMAELGNVTSVSAAKHEEHAKAAHKVSEEEHKVSEEAIASARAFGSMGAEGGELVERFANLTTAAGGFVGTGLGALIVGLGAAAVGVEKVNETYKEQEVASGNLKQAAEVAGKSYEVLNERFEEFVNENARFIDNENDAKAVLASLVRAGFDTSTAMDALGNAVDLAAIKHESLKDAGNQVLLMMEGNGRVAKQLGIDITALKNDDDNAVKAHKDLEEATKQVTAAEQKLAQEQERQKILHDELSAKHKVTAADLERESNLDKQVKEDTDKLNEAKDRQKKAQDDVSNSSKTSTQVQQELNDKLDKGRDITDKSTQSTNQLGHEWDRFAHDTGPAVEGSLNGMLNLLGSLLGAIDTGIEKWGEWSAAAEAALAAGGGAPGGAPPGPPGLIGGGGRRPTGIRQHGGPVVPGGTYTVGEAGPETLVMGPSGGYVVPNSAGGGGGMTNIFNIQAVEPSATASAVLARLLTTT